MLQKAKLMVEYRELHMIYPITKFLEPNERYLNFSVVANYLAPSNHCNFDNMISQAAKDDIPLAIIFCVVVNVCSCEAYEMN